MMRIQRRLHSLTNRPVGTGLAPDAERRLPFDRTARKHQVSPVSYCHSPHFPDQSSGRRQARFTQQVTPDHPIARVGLDGPESRIEPLRQTQRPTMAGCSPQSSMGPAPEPETRPDSPRAS